MSSPKARMAAQMAISATTASAAPARPSAVENPACAPAPRAPDLEALAPRPARPTSRSGAVHSHTNIQKGMCFLLPCSPPREPSEDDRRQRRGHEQQQHRREDHDDRDDGGGPLAGRHPPQVLAPLAVQVAAQVHEPAGQVGAVLGAGRQQPVRARGVGLGALGGGTGEGGADADAAAVRAQHLRQLGDDRAAAALDHALQRLDDAAADPDVHGQQVVDGVELDRRRLAPPGDQPVGRPRGHARPNTSPMPPTASAGAAAWPISSPRPSPPAVATAAVLTTWTRYWRARLVSGTSPSTPACFRRSSSRSSPPWSISPPSTSASFSTMGPSSRTRTESERSTGDSDSTRVSGRRPRALRLEIVYGRTLALSRVGGRTTHQAIRATVKPASSEARITRGSARSAVTRPTPAPRRRRARPTWPGSRTPVARPGAGRSAAPATARPGSRSRPPPRSPAHPATGRSPGTARLWRPAAGARTTAARTRCGR